MLGVEWAHTHRKDKKATLADAMETAFAKSGGDTGRVDDDDDTAAGTETPPADRAQADTPEEETTEPANGTDDDAPAEAPPPAAAERRTEDLAGQEAIDAMNAVPVASGGPRVIIRTVGLEDDDDHDASPEPDPSAHALPGNGHDTGGDPLEVPAFLRRS